MKNFSENSFTDSVRAYLCTKRGVEYTGRFYYTPAAEQEDPDSDIYKLEWLENNQDKPYVMMGDFDSEVAFLEYVCKEIDRQRFWLKQVFTLKRTDAEGKL